MPKCKKCGTEKPLESFRVDKRRGTHRGSCRDCDKEYLRKWVAENKGKVREASKARPRDRRDRWSCHLRRKYGLEPKDYDRMFAAQEGKCAICKTPSPGGRSSRFNVDHCHSSGLVRGLLCNQCNTAIGALQDDPRRMISAIIYLLGAQEAQAFIEAYFDVRAAA